MSGSEAELAEFVVKKSVELGFDEAAALLLRSSCKQVRFAKSKITLSTTWSTVAADILVCKDGKIQTTSTTSISRNSLEKLLASLKGAVGSLRPHESYSPLPEGPFEYEPVPGIYDGRIGKLAEECADIVERAIRAAEEEGASEVAGTLYAKEDASYLRTSRDVDACEKSTSIRIEVRASGEVNGERVYGFGLSCSRALNDLDPERAGRRAGEKVRLSSRIVKAKEGRFDAVFDRPGMAVLLSNIGAAASAFYVDSGLSFLEGKLNEEVAPPRLSIVDDPRMPRGIGSTSFDAEGRPTRTTPVVERGVLKTYLHNRLTAEKFGAKPTANAGWIVPMPWNVVMSPGEASEQELIEETEEGIFVTNATYVRFTNYRTGEFSSIIRDGVFKIERGEIVGCIRGLRLTDSLARMLSSIDLVGSSVEPVLHWWMEAGVPTYVPMARVQRVCFTLPTK